MPTYSPTGYVNAVVIRTARTLLVEGTSDKSVMKRLVIELRNHRLLNSDNILIDTAEEIQNLPGVRLGNREKVEQIHSQMGGLDKFAALVDREFREFDLTLPADSAPYHRVIPVNLFWTRGHSLENYFHTFSFVRATLEQQYPEHLPDNYVGILSHALPGIIRICATMTLAALTIQKLDRIRDVKAINYWKLDGAGTAFVDMPEFHVLLTSRGITPAEVLQFDQAWAHYAPRLDGMAVEFSQWICHGHLAESHVWCGVASLLGHFGMPATTATQVAWGTREAQFRSLTECWCESCTAGIGEWPEDLVNWIKS